MPTRPNQTPPVVRAGIYTRISWDPQGQRAGVERQRVDCEGLCIARGWEIRQYFEDNDRSAYSGKKRRAYEDMLAAVEDGVPDDVDTWHNDRLHRSPRELETFIDVLERSGVRVAVVSSAECRARRGVARERPTLEEPHLGVRGDPKRTLRSSCGVKSSCA